MAQVSVLKAQLYVLFLLGSYTQQCSDMTLGGLRIPCGVLGIEPGPAMYKASALLAGRLLKYFVSDVIPGASSREDNREHNCGSSTVY